MLVEPPGRPCWREVSFSKQSLLRELGAGGGLVGEWAAVPLEEAVAGSCGKWSSRLVVCLNARCGAGVCGARHAVASSWSLATGTCLVLGGGHLRGSQLKALRTFQFVLRHGLLHSRSHGLLKGPVVSTLQVCLRLQVWRGKLS